MKVFSKDGAPEKKVETEEEQGIDALSDQELVRRVRGGDASAFRMLYERHSPKAARRLRAILFDQQDVEDVLQSTFLEAHRALDRFRPDGSFSTWLHGISYNVVFRYLRTRRRRRWHTHARLADVDHQLRTADATPDSQAVGERLALEIQGVLERQSVDKRVAFALFEFEGLGLREIGELVGASPQTVRARVESARLAIKKHLRTLDWAPEDQETRDG
jgi:RNA polymerase sigma-70 factor, ECF subfamily